MSLARRTGFLGVLLVSVSSLQAFAVTTVNYFPFNDGDVRVFHNPTDGTLLYDNVSATTALSTNIWEDRVTKPNGDFVVDLYWLRDATDTREILGGNLHPPEVALNPPVKYPADLTVGGPITTTGSVTGVTGGTYTYSLTVESVDATEGSFTGCVQLLEDVTFSIGPVVLYQDETREWRQSGRGLVAVTPDVLNNPTTVYYLVYADVGGVTYGAQPAANGDFNGDGKVDQLDAQIILDCYLGGGTAYKYVCDIYPAGAPDGVIDQNDLAAFITAWETANP